VGAGVLVGRCVAAGGNVGAAVASAAGWVASEAAGAATVEPGPGTLAPVIGLAAVGAAGAADPAPVSAGATGAGASAPPQAVEMTKTVAITVATMNGLKLDNIGAKSSYLDRNLLHMRRFGHARERTLTHFAQRGLS